MPVKYWMISNRAVVDRRGVKKLGDDRGDLTFYTITGDKAADDFGSWTAVSRDRFQTALVAAAEDFPKTLPEMQDDQRHVTLFVHGYNNSWDAAAKRYAKVVDTLYSGPNSMGVCILFNWPSDGDATGYLPDRADARASAEDFAGILSSLYDWLIAKQASCADDPRSPSCRAKTSVIAHSMGNYLLQCAMQTVWTRKNRPLLMSLINQAVMVAADVDNDLFKSGENIGNGDGEGLANLTYRITALYSGRDSVLGTSAGIKHFGKRRLGRSGIDRTFVVSDNVWDTDCSRFFPDDEKNIHSAYFEYPPCMELIRQILRGLDRGELKQKFTAAPEASIPVTPTAPGNPG